jgi:hypothetical protein
MLEGILECHWNLRYNNIPGTKKKKLN